MKRRCRRKPDPGRIRGIKLPVYHRRAGDPKPSFEVPDSQFFIDFWTVVFSMPHTLRTRS